MQHSPRAPQTALDGSMLHCPRFTDAYAMARVLPMHEAPQNYVLLKSGEHISPYFRTIQIRIAPQPHKNNTLGGHEMPQKQAFTVPLFFKMSEMGGIRFSKTRKKPKKSPPLAGLRRKCGGFSFHKIIVQDLDRGFSFSFPSKKKSLRTFFAIISFPRRLWPLLMHILRCLKPEPRWT